MRKLRRPWCQASVAHYRTQARCFVLLILLIHRRYRHRRDDEDVAVSTLYRRCYTSFSPPSLSVPFVLSHTRTGQKCSLLLSWRAEALKLRYIVPVQPLSVYTAGPAGCSCFVMRWSLVLNRKASLGKCRSAMLTPNGKLMGNAEELAGRGLMACVYSAENRPNPTQKLKFVGGEKKLREHQSFGSKQGVGFFRGDLILSKDLQRITQDQKCGTGDR